MDVIDSKSIEGVIRSLTEQVVKSASELRCAKQDLDTIEGRLNLSIIMLQSLLNKRKNES